MQATEIEKCDKSGHFPLPHSKSQLTFTSTSLHLLLDRKEPTAIGVIWLVA